MPNPVRVYRFRSGDTIRVTHNESGATYEGEAVDDMVFTGLPYFSIVTRSEVLTFSIHEYTVEVLDPPTNVVYG